MDNDKVKLKIMNTRDGEGIVIPLNISNISVREEGNYNLFLLKY